jgi:hypothetical protein
VSRELIISRRFHIASRDGDSNNQVAAATTFVGSNLLVIHFVSLKATTNGEEMSARHIASRDGNNNLSCACTQRCPTVTTNHIVSRGDTNWLRQQHLLSASPSCIHNVSCKSDDEERGIASHSATTYHITSCSGDDFNTSRGGDNFNAISTEPVST